MAANSPHSLHLRPQRALHPHPTKNRAARASSAPGARQAPSPAPKSAVLQSLMSEPLSVEEVQALGEHIAEQAVHLDAAMHRLLADLRTFDVAGGWYRQGFGTCAHWLSWRVGPWHRA